KCRRRSAFFSISADIAADRASQPGARGAACQRLCVIDRRRRPLLTSRDMLTELKERLVEVLKTVMPLLGVVCVLQVAVVQAPTPMFLQFLAGAALVVVGMLLLFMGVDLGILPMGRFVGAELPRKGSITLIVAVAFVFGFATTIAEPDVIVLA